MDPSLDIRAEEAYAPSMGYGATAVRPMVPCQHSARPITERDLDDYAAAFDRLERTPGAYAKIAWQSLFDSFRQRVHLFGKQSSNSHSASEGFAESSLCKAGVN